MKKIRLFNDLNSSKPYQGGYTFLRSGLVLILSVFITTASIAFQGSSIVSGKINDELGAGLPGVNIIEKGTSNGTVSDGEGNYSVQVSNNEAILIFSFIGYLPQEILVGNQTSISITLLPDVTSLQEIIIVGYGEQNRETLTGSVVAVKGKEIVKSPTMDVTNSLAGRLPGVVVIQESGEPGFDGASITIRGRNTLGNTSPLIVIDGVPDRDGGIGRLDPQDIESVSVLKDASAAIYGARAANGAIIVTTRRGQKQKPKVSYSMNYGWQRPTVVPEMSNAVEYANIMNELPIYQTIPVDEWEAASQGIRETGTYSSPTPGIETLNAQFSPQDVELYRNGTDPWGHPDTDWFGDAFRAWAPQTRHHIEIDGGGEKVQGFASLGYAFQDAIYQNSATYYEQYNFRTNLNAQVNDYISTKLDISYRKESRNLPTESAGAIFRMLMRGRPTEPEVWPNGLPGPDIENGQNPYVITTNATGYDKQLNDYLQLTGSIDIKAPWIDGLKLTLQGALDHNFGRRKVWQTPWTLYSWNGLDYEQDGVTPSLEGAIRSLFTDPRLTQTSFTVRNVNLSALLNYEKEIGSDHMINILAGVTQEQFTGEGFGAFRRNYLSTAIDQLFVGEQIIKI